MIEMTDLCKVYRTSDVETTALDGINLQIEKGEFIAIMGPSGCGKSTLLNVLGMLDSASAGTYSLQGERISGCSEQELAVIRKKRLGFIFQSFNLIDELSVRENVQLPLLYQKVKPAERERRVMEVLERVNIAHRADHRPQQLSGGQQQRVAVARAVISNPALILADEPTGNLDSSNGEEVLALLNDLNREGTTIVMVTHDPAHADHATRVVNMLDGRILSENVMARQQMDEIAHVS
ncbi:ABC transporter ATP-binding protein [Congregibacter litoralis]|uniref:ABC-type antimicrobial peptide transport system, ATPase component n=1 Tax=Congregibacter litoralis KT71 TaxID=314285 RepID=A4ABP1_9GAMM|nr:ABC transporter ATP-binding protein [Congregibacter litoralis]EAQ96554.1 ABC-type antimicrobial peptide transport system, ATPase component [Congregibacter litoralis KT71]